MQKKLNTVAVRKAMEAAGLNRTALATKMAVSTTIVSDWLKDAEGKMPRPDKLLRLGMLLKLPFDELVVSAPNPNVPQVAFRKRSSRKLDPEKEQHARMRGELLERLVPHLPFDPLLSPPILKSPSLDYDYVQKVAAAIRQEVGVEPVEPVRIRHLVRYFTKLQVVLVPAMWGKKGHYADGLRIFLPQSKTTWIYMNMDSPAWDFAFWMAHELGHCLSVNIEKEKDEDFSEMFAEALLYPQELAKKTYDDLSGMPEGRRIDAVMKVGGEFKISPRTVAYSVAAYARVKGLTVPLNPDAPSLHAAVKAMEKRIPTIAQVTMQNPIGDRYTPEEYVRACRDQFESPFFDTLKKYLMANPNIGASFIHELLDIPLADAKGLYEGLR